MFTIPKGLETKMICDPDPYYRFNCGEYIANEHPTYFIGRIILCKYCAEIDPMLKIVSSQRYMIQNDFKLIIHLPKHTKISNKRNSTLEYVGICGRILIFYELLESVCFMYCMK
jgi:hypothetical protein